MGSDLQLQPAVLVLMPSSHLVVSLFKHSIIYESIVPQKNYSWYINYTSSNKVKKDLA